MIWIGSYFSHFLTDLLLIVFFQFEGSVIKVFRGECHGPIAIGECHGRLPGGESPLGRRHAWLWSAPVGARWLRLRLPQAPDDDVSTIPPNPVCDARGLGLCRLSALVCDLLSRMGVYPVISWKVGPHRSGALCWWTWCRLLGSPSRIWI